ncbi:SDR family oxidoreductase [Planktothrix agardhii]|uniref:3-oxoacyl-[acyl-carrier-protein] reductase n=1 Tax=Planktothrix agardhii (strain NIVA-CYA 126/8) TaxID=388467 RepID=B7SMU7_PLAA1|nr:SDR family oxidoreductase [Planktothrix agardhii]ACC54553.1 short chain dehydrogenase [Planktothrix agardhii NIVA-CYA 126/8]KEI68582.1 3-oxoacyl-[acyl-carrier-protein] reductase [Planktothrix agardhii NIVA-CYA 126/8]CAD5967074.1 putative oxidoreductase SAS2370 [Planktothrix agardhii]
MFESLSGKKVVIIGMNSGVDLAIANKILELGAKVVLSHPSPEKLNQAIGLISVEIEAKTVNILNQDSVNTFFEEVGNFDHLVVTAIGDRNMPRSLLAEMTTETAQGGMDKFWGTFFAVRAGLKTIATDGSITLTSSVSMFKSSKLGGISVIAAANSAVAAFGRSLALEIAPIRVNVIAPGLIEDTSIWSSQGESERSDLNKWAIAALPVAHLGQPEALAQAVLSLMTNPYMTGVILPVEGGVTLI